MDRWLKQVNQFRAKCDTYEELAALATAYQELQAQHAWKDFMVRIASMRNGVASELLRGTLDKYGKVRDEEKRAVLSVLDNILSIAPTIAERYAELTKHRDEMARKAAGNVGDIHSGEIYVQR